MRCCCCPSKCVLLWLILDVAMMLLVSLGLGFLSCCCFCCWWHWFQYCVFACRCSCSSPHSHTCSFSILLWFCFFIFIVTIISSISISIIRNMFGIVSRNCFIHIQACFHDIKPLDYKNQEIKKWYLPFSSTQCLNIKSIQIKQKFYLNHQRSATSPQFPKAFVTQTTCHIMISAPCLT